MFIQPQLCSLIAPAVLVRRFGMRSTMPIRHQRQVSALRGTPASPACSARYHQRTSVDERLEVIFENKCFSAV